MSAEQLQLTDNVEFRKQEMDLQVGRTKDRLRNRVGHSERVRHRPQPLQPIVAAEILQREGYTIDFDPNCEESRNIGIKTIWEYLAYNHPVDVTNNFVRLPTILARAESAKHHKRTMERAFRALQRHIDVDWQKYPLLIVPRFAGRKKTEVITFDPNYRVNGGQTSAQVYLACTKVRFKNHTRAMIEKLGVVGGEEMMRAAKIFIEDFIKNEVKGPRQALLTLADDRPDDDRAGSGVPSPPMQDDTPGLLPI